LQRVIALRVGVHDVDGTAVDGRTLYLGPQLDVESLLFEMARSLFATAASAIGRN